MLIKNPRKKAKRRKMEKISKSNTLLNTTDWEEIENNVILFKKKFEEGASEQDIINSEEASAYLLSRFFPLIKKYMSLIRHGQIDFNDIEMKQFISLFIDDINLKRALGRKKQSTAFKAGIYKNFNFILETYGALPDEDIMSDLQLCFLALCKRYKQVGKNFCAYVYNSYRYEVARHIKNFIKNPINVQYKMLHYEDCMNGEEDILADLQYEDTYYENETDLPDNTWINGTECSEPFKKLSTIQRIIIVKYYLEDWNDRQIAEFTGLHINTINQKRRLATEHLAKTTGREFTRKFRNRNSGKKASLPAM